eukprot:SAG31_NODE_6330_length_2063_cov_1.400713_1_plen_81_part_10
MEERYRRPYLLGTAVPGMAVYSWVPGTAVRTGTKFSRTAVPPVSMQLYILSLVPWTAEFSPPPPLKFGILLLRTERYPNSC